MNSFKSLTDWLSEPIILPYCWHKRMMRIFVESNIPPLPLPDKLDTWEKERAILRQAIVRQLGLDGLIGRVDINIQKKGLIKRQGYTIEKITYESYPGMAVPALVYIPDNLKGRAPGIVSIGGHNYEDGKAVEHVQARAVNLALRGCIVIAYDYMDCFERNTGCDKARGNFYGGENDHGITSFSFSRRTPTSLEILEGIRAIDYLIDRQDVDPGRIGFTGESGGSNSTYWVSALDERVSLAVAVSSVTTFDYWIRRNVNWDWHQRPPGIMKYADIGTLLALIAPRPLLIVNSRRGTDDQEFPMEEAEKSYQKAQDIYELYGADDCIGIVESITAHGYQQDKREQLYEWVGKWFLGGTPHLESSELPFKKETMDNLTCGLPEDNSTYERIYKEWIQGSPEFSVLPKDKIEAESYQQRLKDQLIELLGLPADNFTVGMTIDHKEKSEGAEYSYVVFETEDRMLVTGLLVVPDTAIGRDLAIYVGRNDVDQSLVNRLLNYGYRVLFLDPRDLGEPYSMPRNWAWFAGRPPVGMWVYDILAIVRSMISREEAEHILLLGFKEYGRTALLAGAAEPLIERIVYSTNYLSFREEANCFSGENKGVVCELPGVLSYCDMAQFASLLAPRNCLVRQAGYHSIEDTRSYYQFTREFYRLFESDGFRVDDKIDDFLGRAL